MTPPSPHLALPPLSHLSYHLCQMIRALLEHDTKLVAEGALIVD